MTTERIATVAPIEEDQASERVSAVYNDIKSTKQIDFIPNFWKVIAVNQAYFQYFIVDLTQIESHKRH